MHRIQETNRSRLSSGGVRNPVITCEPLEGRLLLSTTLDVVAGAGGVKSITYPTVGGATATIAVNGGGSAVVHFLGDTITPTVKNNAETLGGSNVTVTGIDGAQTTPSTILKVTTKNGKGSVSLGQITSNGSFKSIQGAAVVLIGGLVVTGSVAQVNVQAITGGPLTIRTGTATNVKIAASASFDLTAPAVKSISVGGSLTDSSITLLNTTQGNVTDLNTLSVKGAIARLTLTSRGSIGNISASSITGSTIFSGVATLATGQLLPNSSGDFTNVNKISSLKLKRTNGAISFDSSYVAAHNIGTINLGGVLLSNAGIPFGLAAIKYSSLTFVGGASGKAITLNNVTSQAQVTNAFVKAGINPQDFQVKLVS